MTPGDLYEKCVALGLCERAKHYHLDLHFRDGDWWSTTIGHAWATTTLPTNQCEDLATMTVLRALLKEGVVTFGGRDGTIVQVEQSPVSGKQAGGDSLLEALCLCLLRAKGHGVE